MSVLQDISKRLLAVASMPPENRNDALMEVKIEIEGVQYDMVLEQKDLIMNIIDELIAENDADQIAKSKLVFVPDVEEQIAPTKKTRAKKVVAPVMESTLEDLPDTIGQEIPVKDLPEQVKKLAFLRNKQQARGEFNLILTLINAFIWDKTPEGEDFWSSINFSGDLRNFKALYGNKGEKVDEVIEFAGLTEFVEGLSQPVTEAPAPAVKTRKPRTPKIAPVVAPVLARQKAIFIKIKYYLSNAGSIDLEVYYKTELYNVIISILNKMDVRQLEFNLEVVSDLENNKAQIILNDNYSSDLMMEKIENEFDKFVYPPLYWDDFNSNSFDYDRLKLNEKILLDDFKKIKSVAPKVSTPKPVKVVAPKPTKVITPKPVKVVAPKVVKTKVTKPKVEDDLSFLNDLDNIF